MRCLRRSTPKRRSDHVDGWMERKTGRVRGSRSIRVSSVRDIRVCNSESRVPPLPVYPSGVHLGPNMASGRDSERNNNGFRWLSAPQQVRERVCVRSFVVFAGREAFLKANERTCSFPFSKDMGGGTPVSIANIGRVRGKEIVRRWEPAGSVITGSRRRAVFKRR